MVIFRLTEKLLKTISDTKREILLKNFHPPQMRDFECALKIFIGNLVDCREMAFCYY